MLAKQRKVEVVQGVGKFISANQIEVKGTRRQTKRLHLKMRLLQRFRPVKLPFLPDDPRIMDSTGALELEEY